MGGAPASAELRDGLKLEPDRRAAALQALPTGPVVLARERLLAVESPLAGLLVEGGLRRGSVMVLDPAGGAGATSLAVAFAVGASRAGSWGAAVGLPDLGLVAAAQMGMSLDRFALVPAPGEQWAIVAAALIDGVDILLLGTPTRVRVADAVRLEARARERGTAVIVLPSREAGPGGWPGAADVRVKVEHARWCGLGTGHGRLQGRVVDVSAGGRRGAARVRHARLWLPGPDGRVAAAVS